MNKQAFDGSRKTGTDTDVEHMIEEHCKKYGISALEAIKLFPVLSRRQWLKRFLAHADFFQRTLEVPGDIAELGVFRGLGLMTWANLLECYCIGDRTKTVVGFDNWRGFTKLDTQDGLDVPSLQKEVGGFSPEAFFEELKDAIAIYDNDRFIAWKERIRLVEGNIEESVPLFVKENPGYRFSLIHFDCDLYSPTKAALEALWPKLSRGGIMLFDEFAIQDWGGETWAVEEFFEDKPNIQVRTLPWTNSPSGYVVKE